MTLPSATYFPWGFWLSLPLAATLAFGLFSDADWANNLVLLLLLIFWILTLPGSLILVIVGFAAAFSGKAGELIAWLCIALSVVNAHIVAMRYAEKQLAESDRLRSKKPIKRVGSKPN
jgi:hypothetical protein